MIGALIGEVCELGAQGLTLECASGVCYELELPTTDLAELANAQKVKLWTHLVVREDAQLLFGFLKLSCRELFRTLIKMNGVGPKLALTLISHLGAANLAEAVETNNLTMLTKVPGVGKKTAERMMVELRGKLDVLGAGGTQGGGSSGSASHYLEAQAALVSLGYSAKEADKALVGLDTSSSVSELIRAALKQLAG